MIDAHRQRAHHSETTRQAILQAAEQVFAECGYSGARVDAIAAAAGYNKALLFHYFGDKTGLYQEVVGKIAAAHSATLRQALAAHLSGPDGELTRDRVGSFLGDFVRAVFDLYASQPHLLRILAWEAAEGWHTFLECPAPKSEVPWIRVMADYLQRARDAGVLHAEIDPMQLFVLVMGMSMAYLVSIPRHQMLFADIQLDQPEALARVRDQIVVLICEGALV